MENHQALVGKTIPTETIKLPDWKMKFELAKEFPGDPPQIVEVDVCEWELITNLFKAEQETGDWNAYWRKMRDWIGENYKVTLSTSQTYQLFQYIRTAWNTMHDFFDRDLGSAFGIPPTPGDLPTGKSA